MKRLLKTNRRILPITLPLFIFLVFIMNGCSDIPTSSKNWSKKTLKRLSLREKIGQMMIYRMNLKYKDINTKKWEEIKKLISTDGIGGIHLWSGDGSSSLAIMNEIQKQSKIPIIFDADIERGLGQRFSSGTDFPPMMAITATGNPNNAYEVGKIVAKESRAAGVQWNLSPVLDVNNNPLNPIINTRSFSEDPDIVSDYSMQYKNGLQDHGMIATAKHFPGHGDTQTDSHSSLAIIPSDSSRLWSVELKPFIAMSNAGVDAIMVAHVHAPDYQPEADDPATLTKFWVNDMLRKKIGFKGAIITDGMGMGGIINNYSDEYALVKAVQAGCNIIIQNYDFIGSVDAIEKAVLRGDISIDQINFSALKMLELKEKAGLHLNSKVDMEFMMQNIATAEHRAISNRIASEAITLVQDKKSLIPLKKNGIDSIYVIDIYDQEYKHTISSVSLKIKEEKFSARYFQIDESDSRDILDIIVKSIPKNSRVLINAFVSPKQWKNRIFFPDNETYFVREIIKRSNRVILSSLGTPYLLMDFPEVSTYLCAYQGSYIMQQALGEALIGNAVISGRLPISIPGFYEIGSGLNTEISPKKEVKSWYKPGNKVIRVLPSGVNANDTHINTIMEMAIKDSAWPGAALLAAKDGNIFYNQGHGFHTYNKNKLVRSSDIFDLASITKTIGTTSAIMKLVDLKKLDIDKPVINYIPEFVGKKKEHKKQKSKITIRNLLTHSSGLPPFKQYYLMPGSERSKIDSIYNTEPIQGIGLETIYSDVGLIVLGKIIEKVSKIPINELLDSLVFQPLGMSNTFYNPTKEKFHRIVPTEIKPSGKITHGYVHDENAYSLGGVAGHAGLFSTTKDLAIFSQMMLNNGIYGWERIFKESTVGEFTSRANIVSGSSRCLGWDSPAGEASGGVFLSDSSFGHTGFTGTSLWIDPENEITVILLTNAVHPYRERKKPKYYEWRQRVHSAVYEALSFEQMNPSLKLKDRWINNE